jgi:Matrixin
MIKARRLRVEQLEDRSVPATFGVPWSDSTHLTVSLVPDGTAIAGHTSNLFATLDAQFPRDVWQRDLTRAVETWAAAANVNVGVVLDGGQPMGTPGLGQGDARFGDIRVAAQAMSLEVLAISVPHDTVLSTTWSGDVFLNSTVAFGSTSRPDLYTVLLHEFGHVFGLGPSTDPSSVMFEHYTTAHGGLSAGDTAAIQALYGVRQPDANDVQNVNDSLGKATVLSAGDGTVPAVAFGDITTARDVDYFAIKPPSGYGQSMVVHLLTAGVSLLAPKVTVLDAAGRTLDQAQSNGSQGDALNMMLFPVDASQTYYVRVEAASGDSYSVGRYGLAVMFPGRQTVANATIDPMLRGPYDTLSPSDLNQLFRAPTSVFVNDDVGGDNEPAAARVLDPTRTGALVTHFGTVGSLNPAGDVDYYRFKADQAQNGSGSVLTATVSALGANGLTPRIALLDRDLHPVGTQVLANGHGTFTIQSTGLVPKGNYLLEVFADPTQPGRAGNYALTIDLGGQAAVVDTFASGTLSAPTVAAPDPVAKRTLYVGQTQLIQFLLSADPATPGVGGRVQMTLTDARGQTLLSLTAPVGSVVSGPGLLLTPGEYHVTFRAANATGALQFSLRGAALSDPIGPAAQDVTMAPRYVDPQDQSRFSYPGDIVTDSPFLWETLAEWQVPRTQRIARFLAGI